MICSTLFPVIFNNEQLQAMVIFPLILILAYWTKMNYKELGLVFGRLRDYIWAILYPLSICLVIIIIALVTGNIGEIEYPYEMTGKIVYLFIFTLILAITTEEGFSEDGFMGYWKGVK